MTILARDLSEQIKWNQIDQLTWGFLKRLKPNNKNIIKEELWVFNKGSIGEWVKFLTIGDIK